MKCTERILAIAAWVLFLSLNGIYLFKSCHVPTNMLTGQIEEKTADIQLKAIELFFSKLEGIGQTAILVLGALWATLLSKDTSLYVDSWPRWSLFAAASAFLGASYFAYYTSYDEWVSKLFFNKTFDLQSKIIDFWLGVQAVDFGWGLLLAGIFIVISRRKL